MTLSQTVARHNFTTGDHSSVLKNRQSM